jgi:hypothetical protein
MRVVGALAWLPLLLAAYPVAVRAQIVCTGPVSGPTLYCPDCIYDQSFEGRLFGPGAKGSGG